MKATAVLEAQHRRVESILDDLQAGNDPSSLLPELANDLAAHMAIEQNIFYPAIHDVDPHLVEESFEEHAVAELALKRLLKTAPADSQFAARVSILRELIRLHVEEEEEELFPKVEQTMNAEQLEALGEKLEQAFVEVREEGFGALIPETFARTSADDALRFIASSVNLGQGLGS
jgi:hemerythrin superfamily protein